ncbi:hypothetical protein UPYG_G00332620 [Umbra pygmaea]|uniref:Nuclear pore complex protein Nup153 n=1 Tax=Umbra pygmaea TaxID=75934 RepID=A0ABD0VZW9_UMBPY
MGFSTYRSQGYCTDFNAPVVKTGPSVCNEKKTSPVVAAVKHAASEDTDEFEGPFKPAKVLKEGSVLDILKGPGFACPVTRTSPVPKARQETSTANAPSLGDLFKAPAGSWECSMCMVQNKPTDSNCLACMNPQPNSNSSEKMESIPSTSSRLNATTTTTTASGFGSMFSKPAGTWDCDTCLVQNKPEAVKCVACETAKPGTGVKATLTMPAFSEAKTLPTAAPLIGFGDKFKKPEGAWDCDVCMVQNKAQDIKCVSCMSAKPGAAPPQSLPHSTSTTSLLGFGDRFKKPVGAWDCDTCCVQNKAADQECVSCQTPKPGAKVEPKAFGSSSFGIQASSDSSGGFKFGTGLSSNLNTSSGGFKFGTTHLDSSTSGGFKFGLAASSDASADTSSSADFKFGTPAASSLAPGKEKALSLGDGIKFGNTGGFQFGVAVGMENNAPEGGFTFGLSKSEEKTATAAPSSSTFSLPDSTQNPSGASVVTTATTTTTPAAPLFGKPAEAEPPYLATPLGGSVFGETFEKDPAKPSTPAFTFGKPEEKSGSVGTGFLFSASKEEAAPPTGFSFSTPDCKDQSKAPPFTFGKPSDTPESTAVEPAKPSFSFGQSTTDAATPKPAFGFVPSTTTSSAPAPSLFGAPSSSVPATSTFLFGQSASSEATPTKTFLFGQSQDSQPAPETSLSTAPAQPFQFGCRTNCAAPSFAFGAAAPSTASSAAPPAAPSLFMFSPASAAGFGPGQAPAFGSSQPSVPAFGSTAPSPFSTTSSQPPAFGAKPNSVPVFGQQTNSTPSFGSSTPTAPGVGFQFGAASVFGASSNNTGVFAFGGQPGGSPATPTMAPQTTAPALGGGFNFSTPSNFTIGTTKSTTLTTAPTVQHAITGRKIKTAVRRKK